MNSQSKDSAFNSEVSSLSPESLGAEDEVIPVALPVAIPVGGPDVIRGPRTSVGGLDLLIGVAIIWAAEFLISSAIGIVLLMQNPNPGAEGAPHMSPGLLLTASLLSAAIMTGVSWFFVCRKYGRTIRLGFRVAWKGGRNLALCVCIGIVGAVLGGILLMNYSTEDSFMAELVSTPGGLYAVCVMAVLLPPLEEVYYRGFIFPVLHRKVGHWAILIVTIWFGSAHAFQLAGDWVGLAFVVCMGAIWTLQRHLSRSLLPSIVTHWVYNTTLVILSILMP